MADVSKLSFIVEYFDPMASLVRKFQLSYYAEEGALEMYDPKNRRMFLKKCPYPAVELKDLFIGATVTVYARQLNLVDYADEYTRSRLEVKRQRTLAIVKPDAYQSIGKIVDAAADAGFIVGQMKMVKLSMADARAFYAEHEGRPFFADLTAFMSSDVCVAMELVGEDAIAGWRALIGPTDTSRARAEAPSSLRARFGTDATQNAVHGSDSVESARREADFFFGDRALPSTATFDHCSVCIIKPHAVLAGLSGKVIDAVLDAGFEVSAMELFHLDRPSAEEFLEVYKGVLREYNSMVDELCSGPCIVLEVRAEEAVSTFRELCGPFDVEIAKVLRPDSLRGKFGSDKVKNAVHCTDLPEDGRLESEYFFSILQKK
eukprot:PLAT11672.1.p1 GENE.PLAT11672.1~~PLAT11672.1.p1  ORF type:complete len:385 (-),score=132.72 PLAT11672.1:131-1255(-)